VSVRALWGDVALMDLNDRGERFKLQKQPA
jgi:hypothetical protein